MRNGKYTVPHKEKVKSIDRLCIHQGQEIDLIYLCSSFPLKKLKHFIDNMSLLVDCIKMEWT